MVTIVPTGRYTHTHLLVLLNIHPLLPFSFSFDLPFLTNLLSILSPFPPYFRFLHSFRSAPNSFHPTSLPFFLPDLPFCLTFFSCLPLFFPELPSALSLLSSYLPFFCLSSLLFFLSDLYSFRHAYSPYFPFLPTFSSLPSYFLSTFLSALCSFLPTVPPYLPFFSSRPSFPSYLPVF